MQKLSFLLKSYGRDIQYVDRLLQSYHKYNVENIPMYLVVPESDISKFRQFETGNIELLSDESICDNFVSENEIPGFSAGYINQQIIKLSFWEKELTENYFCVDSDGVFIRDFFLSDFMFDNETPYTILADDKELIVDPEYYRNYWQAREKSIQRICYEIGFEQKSIRTNHGFSIFSTKVLKSFREKFMKSNDLTYVEILKIAPFEFSWYNLWLQKDRTIQIEIIEPLIKYFHLESHHLQYLQKGITEEDIARGYLGYVVNSNYSRDHGLVSYTNVSNPYKLTLKSFTKKVAKKIKHYISKFNT